MTLPPLDKVSEASTSSRVGSVDPLRVMAPLLRKVPPSTSVASSATTMAPKLTPVPVPSAAVKVPAVTSSAAPCEVTIAPMVGSSEAVLLTTPPAPTVAWVLEPGMPLVQLLVVDQTPVPPDFQLSGVRLMTSWTIAELVPRTPPVGERISIVKLSLGESAASGLRVTLTVCAPGPLRLRVPDVGPTKSARLGPLEPGTTSQPTVPPPAGPYISTLYDNFEPALDSVTVAAFNDFGSNSNR